jgi:TolB-like protein
MYSRRVVRGHSSKTNRMKGSIVRGKIKGLFFLAVFSMALATGLYAEKQVKIAFVKIENRSMDPRYDYLEGILSGILLFDLANDPGLLIVDRSSLDAILKEQELALSDLSNADQAVRVGRIMGADYLLKGQYVFLGSEAMVSLSLVEVETAKTLPFTERGSSENLVHGLAEKIIERLTGTTVTLRSAEHDRSIISLKDEKPGSITLYCNLINAEIFVDDQFVSYTTGKSNVPVELTDLKPGRHTVRVHLGSFGVVKTPEITFSDWQQVVDIKPGQKQVLRASITLFTYQLYDLQKLFNGNDRLYQKDFSLPYVKEFKKEFIDREGKKHTVVLKVVLTITKEQAEVKAEFTYDGTTQPISLVCPAKKQTKNKQTVEKADVSLALEYNPDRYCRIDYRVTRNDISTDMW